MLLPGSGKRSSQKSGRKVGKWQPLDLGGPWGITHLRQLVPEEEIRVSSLGHMPQFVQLMSSQDEQETLKDFSRKSCRGRSSSDRNHPPRPLSQALSLLINDLLDVPPHCPLLSTTVTHSEDPEAEMSSYLISVASRRLTDANLSTALSA